MRRSLIAAVSAALLLSALPAGANHKTIRDSFTAMALPFPVGSYDDGEGCIHGVENVHKVSHEFSPPFSGVLTVETAQPIGDWDLFILDDAGKVITESSDSQGVAEEVSLKLKAKQNVSIVVCNWAGEPAIEVSYEHKHV